VRGPRRCSRSLALSTGLLNLQVRPARAAEGVIGSDIAGQRVTRGRCSPCKTDKERLKTLSVSFVPHNCHAILGKSADLLRAGPSTGPIGLTRRRSGSKTVDPALPCRQPFRLSGGRFCCEQLILEPQSFGQQLYHFGHVCHFEYRSADDLRSSPIVLSGKDAEIDNTGEGWLPL
jgi:hypothetical protein